MTITEDTARRLAEALERLAAIMERDGGYDEEPEWKRKPVLPKGRRSQRV